MKEPKVGIIMGSDSDLPVMQEAAILLEELGIPFECTIVSAHRTPERLYQYSESAMKKGLEVIIAGAGGAAHLPGMVAAISILPVVGVPIRSNSMNGIDSVCSILQMPPGVPVATVAINGGRNAGILAAEILAIKYPSIREALLLFKENMKRTVEEKAEKLEKIGYLKYLEEKMKS
ncbi:5-(carboxyamino)imidazole ribonucleotide mutase [Alkaliphilus serpentinus]|uniref:N5-carboxyaminoimidazole ribonucleotide mutase n=1 Tax=Alkaliphilus serpentinus TaxID=1482731 RepID=A0A833HQT2_9FIRM|nr:5-(carboxyamino)imidazole ribonucleotide mutase [Alkaliphilus serpentinus]KAB3532108.1 5-(carboxyamino)imidazole ribonucleotide mutase [Alkaliphilus serpentinus]